MLISEHPFIRIGNAQRFFAMMNRFCLLILAMLAVLPSQAQTERRTTVYEYIEKYKKIAIEEMHRTRIPASITMSQALLESSNGNSRLAREGNNHFGIKCKKGWAGKTIFEDDDAEQECFRAYDNAEASYRDHSEFLTKNPRYAPLFELEPTDYKGWAQGLRTAGYATNPNYATILIDLIERHKLFEFDRIKPGELDVPRDITVQVKDTVFNKIPAVKVGKDDDVPEIAARYDMKPRQIYKYNDLPKGTVIQPGEILYLKPKRRKGTAEVHVVKEGESMHYISQLYAIKLKQLYKKNRMEPGTQPVPGETIYMRQKADETPDTVKKKESVPSRTASAEPKKSDPVKKPDPDSAYAHPYKPKLVYTEPRDTTPKQANDKVYLHTVRKGETLFSIARLYNKSVAQIMELNNLHDYSLSEGQKLIINANSKESAPDITKTDYYHVVKEGETLYGIARKYNLLPADLKQMNKLSSDVLSPGMKLYVYKAPSEQPEKAAVPEKPEFHDVKKGETLYSIARQYGVTVEELRKWNNLENDSLVPGRRIRVRSQS